MEENKITEVLEEVELVEEENYDYTDEVEETNGNGLIIGAVIGGLTAGGAYLIHKLWKSKKGSDDQPKKKKKFHIGWVDVEEPQEEISEVAVDEKK